MIRVALVDDHSLVRAGMKALVLEQAGYEVVAEGADGLDVEGIVERTSPDILILDISMKRRSGLDVLDSVMARFPALRVLILSMHMGAEYVLGALRQGASGYLIKDAAVQELGLAMGALMRGERYLSPGIAQMVIQSALHVDAAPVAEAQSSTLTPRQSEVLRLLARGCSTRDMAHGLGLSIKTIETHRAQIMERLAVRDVPSLVRYAIRTGLVRLDE